MKSEFQKAIADSVDTDRLARLRAFNALLLGLEIESESEARVRNGGGMWQHYDPIRQTVNESRKLNHMQHNVRLLSAQARAAELMPEWTNLDDDIQAEIRRQWWQWRSKGLDGLGGWKQDADCSFADMAALGEGYQRIGLADTGEGNAVTHVHYHPSNVLWDAFAKFPDESDWFAFSTVYPVHTAAKMFPDFDVMDYSKGQYNRSGIQAHGIRVIEAFSRQMGDLEPKYIAILEDVEGEVLMEEANPYGACLPRKSYQGFITPGSDVPMGIVAATLYCQEEIVRMDEDSRKKSMRDNLMGIPKGLLTPESWKQLSDNKRPWLLEISEDAMLKTEDLRNKIVTIPRNGENSDQKERRQEMFSQMATLAGIPVWSAGQAMAGGITARETDNISARVDAQNSAYQLDFARGEQNGAPNVAKIAKMYDTAPFCAKIQNAPVWFNKDNPNMTSQTVWDGSHSCVIGDAEIMASDSRKQKAERVADAMQIYQLTQSPEALRELLVAMGKDNPEDYMGGMQNPQLQGAPQQI